MNPRHSYARPAVLAALCLGAALTAGCASNRETATMGASGESVDQPAKRSRMDRPYPNNMDDPTRATDPRSSAVNPERNRGGPATGTTVPPGNIVP